VMVILAVNIGQLVFDKIRLQYVADSCALAAATVQAAGLNEIADLNNELVNEYWNLRADLRNGIWCSAGQAVSWVGQYWVPRFDYIRYLQLKAYGEFNSRAAAIAQQVMDENKNLANRYWQLQYTTVGPPTLNYQLMPPRYYDYLYYFAWCKWCYSSCRGLPGFVKTKFFQWGVGYVPVEIMKTDPPLQCSLILMQSSQNYAFGSSLFGYAPPLKAVAAAKPAGGDISALSPAYRPVLIQ
jgi:hypothetical protein